MNVRCNRKGAGRGQVGKPLTSTFVVGTAGFEPATSASRTLRATKLRHVPIDWIVSVGWAHARSKFLSLTSRVG